MKRTFDILFSLGALALAWPILALIGMGVFLNSGSPVLFSQTRVGLGERPFSVKKFRTMRALKGAEAGFFEPGSRARVTPFGQFLRAWKVDELPQLWNVLKGEMSFVGPRPEIRRWVDAYPERWRKVLTVRPGITDPASLVYRDEEEILASSSDPEKTYREVILPHKLKLYEEYVNRRTFAGDFMIIVETLGKIVVRSEPGSSPKR